MCQLLENHVHSIYVCTTEFINWIVAPIKISLLTYLYPFQWWPPLNTSPPPPHLSATNTVSLHITLYSDGAGSAIYLGFSFPSERPHMKKLVFLLPKQLLAPPWFSLLNFHFHLKMSPFIFSAIWNHLFLASYPSHMQLIHLHSFHRSSSPPLWFLYEPLPPIRH